MKTAISLPDDTFARADAAAKKLGISRSQFFAKAAERWLYELEGPEITEAINRALEGVEQDTEFLQIAAHRLARDHGQW